MDGLYEMNIKTPMGNIQAKVKLITNGNEWLHRSNGKKK